MRGSVGMHSDSPHGRPSMPDQEFRFSGTEVHGHIIVPIRRTCDDANGPAGYYLIPGPITTSIARKCHSAVRPGLDEPSLQAENRFGSDSGNACVTPTRSASEVERLTSLALRVGVETQRGPKVLPDFLTL